MEKRGVLSGTLATAVTMSSELIKIIQFRLSLLSLTEF